MYSIIAKNEKHLCEFCMKLEFLLNSNNQMTVTFAPIPSKIRIQSLWNQEPFFLQNFASLISWRKKKLNLINAKSQKKESPSATRELTLMRQQLLISLLRWIPASLKHCVSFDFISDSKPNLTNWPSNEIIEKYAVSNWTQIWLKLIRETNFIHNNNSSYAFDNFNSSFFFSAKLLSLALVCPIWYH